MGGMAIKSVKAWVKCDNGYTASGRQSTKTYNFKGANSAATADNYVGSMSSVLATTTTPPIQYGKTVEQLVSDQL